MIHALEELFNNLAPKQQEWFKKDAVYLEQFIVKYNVSLMMVGENGEHFPPEGLMYYFDDGFGGYSIKGIKNSLEDQTK